MGFVRENYRALRHYVYPPPRIEDKSPEELMSRAEHAILDVNDSKSEDSLTDEKVKAASQSSSGMDCTVHNLYKDRKNAWSDKYPHYIDDPVESTATSRYAIIVRNQRCTNGRRKFQIESLTVQSPLLKQALGDILRDYPGITTDVAHLEFNQPFAPFVHRWHAFEQATVKEKHKETKQHLALLWNVLEAELKDLLQKMKDHERHGVVDYETIWTLFDPSCLVFTNEHEMERVDTCVKCTPGTESSNVELRYIDWDGNRYGTVMRSVTIPSFTGTKALQDLQAMPLSRHPDKEGIEARAKARGRRFESLQGHHFMYYEGVALDIGSSRFDVDSRIIVDTSAFNIMNRKHQLHVVPFASKTRLRGSDLLLTNTSVRAYSLRDKKWFHCFVNDVKPITFSASAFDMLVLPPASKSLVHAFASAQLKGAVAPEATSDLIQGKGQGTVMLLSGPPGVGKTLTAESMAEEMQVPLYMLSAGDLGTIPSDVEKALINALELCAKWNAVLLLDEADVFLRERKADAGDLERNKLVSIFLRVLEYHRGFLVLTTNRLSDLDAAFESRIHLALKYRMLDDEGRKTVWNGCLKTQKVGNGDVRARFGDTELSELTKTELNGRQIKNSVRSASMLAKSRGQELSMDDVRTVLKVREENASGAHGASAF